MALFPPDIISVIGDCAHWADRLVRSDLVERIVVSENDYTSNFTSAFRREINARSIPGLRARIQVLNKNAEQKMGADACIVFQNDKVLKIGIFESKWPRLSTHSNAWDSIQKSSGDSHFHSQLVRQKQHAPKLAIWEMFYCEEPFEKQQEGFPNYGSACVWHDAAYSATNLRSSSKSPWTDTELEKLLTDSSREIREIVKAICECNAGEPIPVAGYKSGFGDVQVPYQALVISYSTMSERKPHR